METAYEITLCFNPAHSGLLQFCRRLLSVTSVLLWCFFNTIVLAYSIPFLTHCYILHFVIAIPKSFMLLFECFLANCLTGFFYDSLKLPTVLNLVGWIRNKRTLYYDQPFLYSVLCPFSPTVYTFCFTCNKRKHFKNHLPSVVLNRLYSITKYRQYWVHIYC